MFVDRITDTMLDSFQKNNVQNEYPETPI